MRDDSADPRRLASPPTDAEGCDHSHFLRNTVMRLVGFRFSVRTIRTIRTILRNKWTRTPREVAISHIVTLRNAF